jgi:hypothetical protein
LANAPVDLIDGLPYGYLSTRFGGFFIVCENRKTAQNRHFPALRMMRKPGVPAYSLTSKAYES